MSKLKISRNGWRIDAEIYLKHESNEKVIYEINTNKLKVFVFDSDNNSFGKFIRLRVEATNKKIAEDKAYEWDKANHCNCCGRWYFEFVGVEEIKNEE